MLPKGTKIQGQSGRRYEMVDHLSRSAAGELYQARMSRHEGFVTVQFIAPRYAFIAERMRFLQETKIGVLSHKHIVTTIGLDMYQDHPMLINEFMDMGSARQQLARQGPLDEEDALRVIRDVSLALGHLEKHHVVHRDVNPMNIMLMAQGRAKLTGLGVVQLSDSEHAPALPANVHPADFVHALTIIKGHPGTIPYMSPEQATGSTLDGRSDLYSLGVCLFELLTGACPFEPNRSLPPAESRHELLTKIVKQSPPDPRNRRGDLSKQTAALVLKMLEKDMSRRYQRAGDLVKAIDSLFREWSSGATVAHPLERPELAGVYEALADPTITRKALVAGEIIGTPKGFSK